MDSQEFRRRGKEMVDFIADYFDTIRDRRVVHNITFGYMSKLVPKHPPEDGESWDSIFADIERVIMPGVNHWRSPQFHGYFASGGSFPSLMADMLSDALGCVGFSWSAIPACTELEMHTTDWVGEMIGLPRAFLHSGRTGGGGVIQSTASETIFFCMLVARTKKRKEIQSQFPNMTSAEITSKLVCYTSDMANCCIQRAGLLAEVQMRTVTSDDNFRLRGDSLLKAIKEDTENGLFPFFVCATLGTTSVCSFDNVAEIGPVCQKEDIWLHIDAAYAGSAFVCPEFRHFLKGVEFAQTISVNTHKFMLVNFDASVMWIRDYSLLEAFHVDPAYLRSIDSDQVQCLDYRHWQVPLGRRFRSLKLWFTIRSYGVSGIRKHIRQHVTRAKEMEALLMTDGRFDIVADVIMGLVSFRLKGPNQLTEILSRDIHSSGLLFLNRDSITRHGKDIGFLRFAIVPERITKEDIEHSFSVISASATRVIQGTKAPCKNGASCKNGTSLLPAL